MKTLTRLIGSWVILLGTAVGAPSSLFLNEGLLQTPLVIDATVFVNLGTIDFPYTALPYETQNTLVYTNRGNILTTPGINFQYIDDAGNRLPADRFYNGPGARINSQFGAFSFELGPWGNELQPLYGGFLSINATNIVNRGTLEAFYSGDIQIQGVNVDLSSSRIGQGPIPFSTYAGGETNFFPETILNDRWWRYSETGIPFDDLASINPQGGVDVATPRFRIYTRVVTQPDDTGGPYTSLNIDNGLAFVAKLQPSETNQQFEVVFVSNPDPAVSIDVSWQPGPDPVNAPAYTAYVRFTTVQPDLISQGPGSGANQFVIVDTFGSEPNEVLQLNVVTDNSQKPFNLYAFRAFPSDNIIPGFPIGSVPTNSDFYTGMFTRWVDDAFPDGVLMTNRFTTNRYATWSGILERYPSSVPNLPGPAGNYTNLAGRVMISGENLNLKNTRIQGQSLVSIQTDNLISSRGAVVDAPILNLDLASQSGTLVVQDLAKGSPSRFGGGFSIWSTTFTNFWQAQGTNEGTGGGTGGTPIDVDGDGEPDGCDTDGDGVIDLPGDCPADPGTGGETTVTNYTAIYHVTVIENTLTSGVGVFLNDLRVRGENVDLRDQLSIDGRFSANATNLTISGALNLFTQNDLVGTDLVGLETLTNLGSLSVPGFLGLGLAPSPALKVIANHGSASATGISVGGDRVENSGIFQANGGNVQINADEYDNDGGSLNALFDVILNANDANLSGIHSTAGGSFILNVPGTLEDGGLYFPGVIEATYGIVLPVKPSAGSLLGTTVNLVAPQFGFTESYWAAEDLGPTLAGYENNAALGTLSLDSDIGGTLTFNPVDSVNAIYVQHLEISDLVYADVTNAVVLTEGMTLYYATTSDNVIPADLDGKVSVGGGTFRWVKDGDVGEPVALVSVVRGDGLTIRIPKALRESLSVDSDGDGLVNGADSSPFDLVVVSRVDLVGSQPPYFRVEWVAAPGQTYQVQSTVNLKTGVWNPVKTVVNPSSVIQRMILEDPVDPDYPMKSYRVIVNP